MKCPNDASKYLVAKIDDKNQKWIPLWVHSADAYCVMQFLLDSWLPQSTYYAIGLEKDDCKRIASLLAILHDIGKASLVFQSKITENAKQLRDPLLKEGIIVPSLMDSDCADREELPHATAGELLLLLQDLPISYAAIVGAHHGKPWVVDPADLLYDLEEDDRDGLIERGLYGYGSKLWGNASRKGAWIEVQNNCFHWMMSCVDNSSFDSLPTLSATAAVLMTGLVIAADWMASNTDYFPLLSNNETAPDNLEERFRQGISKLQLPPPWQPEMIQNADELTQKRFGFSPNSVQSAMLRAIQESEEPGLLILEAPMGVGKTEAALLGAEHFSSKRVGGIFFGLPTQATANGIFERVIEWGQKQTEKNQKSIRLAHGMAQLNEQYQQLFGNRDAVHVDADGQETNRLIVHEWFQGSKKALLADFVVGTVDQFLMASLQQKHVMLRHLGLCGKAVIIDECHAYDAYMNQYLEGTLQWLGQYHTPVIMLSATLPYERRAAFIDAYLNRNKTHKKVPPAPWRTSMGYPLLTWTDGKNVNQVEIPYVGNKKTISLTFAEDEKDLKIQADSVARLLQEKLREGGCAAVIVNTVQRAQTFATVVRQAMPEYDVLLLHSQYVMPERLRYENELLKRAGKHSRRLERDRLIIIGTQVVEQSLDFDVDFMISDLCPMDLLLQRLGRLHRHPHHDLERPKTLQQPQCCLLCAGNEIEGGAAAVYGAYLLMRTRAMLPENIMLPDDISLLVQKVYDTNVPLPQEPEDYQKAMEDHIRKTKDLQTSARKFRLSAPDHFEEGDISELLNKSVLSDEEHGIAQVRNGEMSVEVLVVVQHTDGSLSLLPEEQNGERWFSTICPSERDCKLIAAQRLRLPHKAKKLLDASSVETLFPMPTAWKTSIWLHREHLLGLDENLEANIAGQKLLYREQIGLLLGKEEDNGENSI